MSTLVSLCVRMYRNLLGDCFLLRVGDDTGAIRHILIDCGLLQGLDRQGERLAAVAEDIRTTTGGHVDLLVITHEHWDHISGFVHAADTLLDPAKMTYAEVWMAWTEKPGDSQADALRARFERRKFAIASLAASLEGNAALRPLARDLGDVAQFIGPVEAEGLAAAGGGRWTGRRVLERLKQMAGTIRYLEPGDVLDAPVGAPLPVGVLGPPRNETRLFKDLPSRGDAKETYLDEELIGRSMLPVDAGAATGAAMGTAVPGGAPAGSGVAASPFAPRYSHGLDTDGVRRSAEGDGAWLRRRYFEEQDDEGRPQAARRIDDVGFEAAESLALKLDSDTNNTSLVLAFRLPDDRFLLFTGDAQVGNWQSWHDQDYAFADRRWTAAEILATTALYKVGHHGSHNATLRKLGLEMMTRGDLVAMISTVAAEAETRGKPPGWQMPDADVRAALLARTGGRLIRGDRAWADDPDIPAAARTPAFTATLDETHPLWVEYRLIPST